MTMQRENAHDMVEDEPSEPTIRRGESLEDRTTHMGSENGSRECHAYLIPWVETIVVDHKLFDLIK